MPEADPPPVETEDNKGNKEEEFFCIKITFVFFVAFCSIILLLPNIEPCR